MPFTLSHPLAVVPLRRFCPRILNFAALMIGSTTPDIGYYIRQMQLAHFAHTITGTFMICLPVGIVELWLFYYIRRPICFLLPQPHRSLLSPLASPSPGMSIRLFAVATISVLIGAWTHTIWDSFTHDGGWAVQRLSILRLQAIHIGSNGFPVYYLLQQGSTFGAAAVLVFLYFRWVQKQLRVQSNDSIDGSSDRWRYQLFIGIVLASLLTSLPAALRAAAGFGGLTATRVFVFRITVYSLATSALLLVISAVAVYLMRKRRLQIK